ncbi:DUF808 domain-containing protein [Corticibacter populi]|uniref:DUF808 domain-containing protein n=1 Tax=Corticibacter populi TaxID=1550736 RepID=A0A3M6QSZ1_9BURK|nr:DUF808 domain-containing protein [Corticibacter populi]RMX05971.1 DUF808 domain-containing protein [Corticibacter populi]RZS30701.1 hypothetical protein EV687_2888 [Corticibacter populi]
MAAAGLLMLLDDIATILDDVAVMSKMAARKSAAMADDVAVLSKVAAQKTAGVLGDDLALNAQQVTGVSAQREIPVVWAVAKGSLVNKLVLVPLALLISALLPQAITPLLMLGGAFLCYEGAEKILHKLLHQDHAGHAEPQAPTDEKTKVRGAIRTDFILSAEIIAITLGVVEGHDLTRQAVVLGIVALAMTVFVYGLVAGIVKLDDLGLWLTQRASAAARASGRAILALAPWLMKALSVLGTAAMFLVGGGIIVHGVASLHHGLQDLAASLTGNAGNFFVNNLGNALVGLALGLCIVGVLAALKRLRGPSRAS